MYPKAAPNARFFENISYKGYFLVYQIIVDRRGRIVKLEALLRSSSFKQMSVPQLLAFAERTGTTGTLDAYVLEKALSQLAIFQKIHPTLVMSVNLSPSSLVPGLARKIEAQLVKANISPEFLTLEITESQAIGHIGNARQCIQEIQALGCKVFLDDFCTRYSTLNHLAELGVDGIKIDRSYVWLTNRFGYERYLIDSLARIGHGFNLKMVAEGVETQQQLKKVQQLGIQYIQGYFFYKPLSAKKVIECLAENEDKAA